MSTDLVPQPNGVLVPADLSTPQAVHDYLSALLPATRGEGKGTLPGALVPWLCDRVPSENGRKAYGRDLRQFLGHLQAFDIDPTDVTGDDVRMYKEALRQAGMASSTIARKLSVIRGTYEQWGKKGFVNWETVADIQSAESPRVEKNGTPGLTQAEASELLKVAREKAAVEGRFPHERLLALRDYAILFTFFRTACRVSAIAGASVGHLERTDTDWYLRVTEKGNKRSRKILLEAAAAILAYLDAAGIRDDREGPLFRPLAKDRRGFSRKHLDRKDVLDIVKRHARAAGIDVDRIDSRGVGVHSLRKTTITNALNNGAPMHQVQELAGHADIRTTQGYYMRKDSDAEAAGAAHSDSLVRHNFFLRGIVGRYLCDYPLRDVANNDFIRVQTAVYQPAPFRNIATPSVDSRRSFCKPNVKMKHLRQTSPSASLEKYRERRI